MGRILVRWKSFRNDLEMLCHPICNWLYVLICDNKSSIYGAYDFFTCLAFLSGEAYTQCSSQPTLMIMIAESSFSWVFWITHTRRRVISICVCNCVCKSRAGTLLAYVCVIAHTWMSHESDCWICYWVATISRLLEIIVLFCKRALPTRLYSAEETYHFKGPTNRSHPIITCRRVISICVCNSHMCVIRHVCVCNTAYACVICICV